MSVNLSILYTGAFRFPDGDAAAARVLSISKLFLQIEGVNVDIAGWEQGKESYIYDNLKCYPRSELDKIELNPIKRLFKFIFKGVETFSWIRKYSNHDIIVLYNPPAVFAFLMVIWAKFSKKKLILDSTEWYENEHLIGGKFGVAAFENCIRMRLIYPMFKNIICISDFLHSYYSTFNRNVIKIYPIKKNLSLGFNVQIKGDREDKIVFIYAGQLGQKDKVTDFIKKLPKLKVLLNQDVVLQIVGSSYSEIKANLLRANVNVEDYIDYLEIHGKLKQSEVFSLLDKADFSILFRDNKRYALAGFPTKGMESLTLGCPIILNNVGDIAKIVKDNKLGIIVSETFNANEIYKNIIEFGRMKPDVAASSERFFSSSAYLSEFKSFIKRVN